MDKESRAGVLKVISDVQQNTSSVTVQIGGTKENDMVENDTLYIKNAPARIVNELTDMGYSLSVTDDGVRVEDYKR